MVANHMPKNGLPVINGKVADTTCYSAHAKYEVACGRKRCQNWLPLREAQNCTMIAAAQGSHTLERIGKIYGVSRMRICQIEKEIKQKILKEAC